MNRLQTRNQRAILRSLKEPKLVGSVRVDVGHLLDVEELGWDDYWNDCQPLTEQLAPLNAAWLDLIESAHAPTAFSKYVSAYFALLKACLKRALRGEVGLSVLWKVIGFETFHILDQDSHAVAGAINVRHPAYLLSKVAQPKAFDDPKSLPLICPFRNDSAPDRLYCHYRRIPVADVFYRNPSMFRRLVFQQGSLFDWVGDHADDTTSRFDFVLMLRVLDVFSRFHIEELSRFEAAMLIHRDRQKIVLDENVLDPAKLIESDMQHRIQHSIKRTRLRRGSIFYQFSLSDYFKAMRLITGGNVDGRDETIYVPIRRFDDGAFVLPSGHSMLGQLTRMADRVIIEDGDLTARHLREHLERFDVGGLRVTDVTDRQRMRGASVTLVEKIA